jgi:DNA-binding NarL/FixJ family response regulator
MRERRQLPGPSPRIPLANAGAALTEAVYWETRVLRQRFTAPSRPGSEKELFARLEHDGQWVYFPLGSEVREQAAVRACELRRDLADDGWNVVRRRYVRQIIWSIFWFSEPLACTYATLFTVLEAQPTPAKAGASAPKPIPVALVQPEPEVLRGLERCVNQTPGYLCVQTAALAKELLQRQSQPASQPRLVLYDQHSLNLAADTFEHQLQSKWPGVIAVPFGIFGHSDELFLSVTLMDRGYFLRRRPPSKILEPLSQWQGEGSIPSQLRTHLAVYFRQLLPTDNQEPDATVTDALSEREAEIVRLLGSGQTDKTIAEILGISVWTVHAHVRRVFEKLGVHTRAEAVMRHLQK